MERSAVVGEALLNVPLGFLRSAGLLARVDHSVSRKKLNPVFWRDELQLEVKVLLRAVEREDVAFQVVAPKQRVHEDDCRTSFGHVEEAIARPVARILQYASRLPFGEIEALEVLIPFRR